MRDDRCVFNDCCLNYDFNSCDTCPGDNRCEKCIHLIKKDEKNHIGFCDLRNDDKNFEDSCNLFA